MWRVNGGASKRKLKKGFRPKRKLKKKGFIWGLFFILKKEKMYLSYDVVKYILEIKYKNWVDLKQCICGYDDFKVCYERGEILFCADCENIYCNGQLNLSDWLWYCDTCEDYYCGDHPYYEVENARCCDYCVKPMRKNPKCELSAIDYKKQKILFAKRWQHMKSSPEY